jgi:hypothetical protein
MFQLIHERDLRMPFEDGVGVHLLEHDAVIGNPAARDDLQIADLDFGVGPAVGLDKADDYVMSGRAQPVALFEHGEGLADAGRRPEEDTEVSARGTCFLAPYALEHLLGGRPLGVNPLPCRVRFYSPPTFLPDPAPG